MQVQMHMHKPRLKLKGVTKVRNKEIRKNTLAAEGNKIGYQSERDRGCPVKGHRPRTINMHLA